MASRERLRSLARNSAASMALYLFLMMLTISSVQVLQKMLSERSNAAGGSSVSQRVQGLSSIKTRHSFLLDFYCTRFGCK